LPLSSSSPLSNVSSTVHFVFRAVATWTASFGLMLLSQTTSDHLCATEPQLSSELMLRSAPRRPQLSGSCPCLTRPCQVLLEASRERRLRPNIFFRRSRSGTENPANIVCAWQFRIIRKRRNTCGLETCRRPVAAIVNCAGNLYPFPKALEYLGEKVLIKVTADAAAKEWIPDVYEQRALVLNCL